MTTDSAPTQNPSKMSRAQSALFGAAASAIGSWSAFLLATHYVADENLRDLLKTLIEVFGGLLVVIYLVLAALRFINQKLNELKPRAAPLVRYIVATLFLTAIAIRGFYLVLSNMRFKDGDLVYWAIIPAAVFAGIATTQIKRLWLIWQISRHIRRKARR